MRPSSELVIGDAFERAGITYQIVGSFAVFLHVETVDWLAARLTGVVDWLVDGKREGVEQPLATIRMCTRASVDGWTGIVDRQSRCLQPSAIQGGTRPRLRHGSTGFAGDVLNGIGAHQHRGLPPQRATKVQDMDSAGLITPEIEASLSEPLRARLAEVRATE